MTSAGLGRWCSSLPKRWNRTIPDVSTITALADAFLDRFQTPEASATVRTGARISGIDDDVSLGSGDRSGFFPSCVAQGGPCQLDQTPRAGDVRGFYPGGRRTRSENRR
jgi:hypothetical protein